MKAFTNKIDAAIQDPVLQSALDANAIGRENAWKAAFEAMPYDLAAMRQDAHRIRKDVIENLDDYLARFIQQAQANGFIIHRAVDAHQANEIVLQIAQQNNAKLIAKSKTMVSEEIELNPALEAAGIRVVETDLGEFIIQLRDEKPGHIITPAVHLKRDQVGATFHEHLGIPFTDDVQVLNDVARKTLREVFLTADIGISGVNFGIANAGAIALLTNEGNGRMVTSQPPVHIALMGIERLVPDYDDFCTLLALLPRASTGQPITVYTQIIHGPRREDEFDGAKERHIILVDNGRTQTKNSWLSDALMCIRCGACLNACPIFREISGHGYIDQDAIQTPYSGPIGSVISPALFGVARYGHLAQASTLCGACKDACPVDIDLPGLLLRIRAGDPETSRESSAPPEGVGVSLPIRMAIKTFGWAASRPRWFSFAQKMAGVVTSLFGNSQWLILPKASGWGYSKDIFKPAQVPFREQWQHIQQSIGRESKPAAETIIQPPSDDLENYKEQNLDDYFTRSLVALEGIVIPCDRNQLVQRVVEELQSRKIESVTAWDSLEEDFHLISGLQKAGIRIHGTDSQAQAGITGATAGVAETGSIVLTAAIGKPASTSLLPPIHIAILEENRIYKNLPHVFNMEEVTKASSVTIISGPSRTADIEMTLTIGVHGPGEVIVFLLR